MSSRISINSNISSLRAQRQLGAASDSLRSSFEKLSSGLRINKASDDAAGLAVASSLRADTRIYSQGIRNLNDGISALNIADGALSNLSSIVIRLEELAEQSANGAVGSKQRQSLDDEAQALAKEYFRISKTTQFNGLKLLNGSTQGFSLQAGYGSSGTILSSLGGALGTGTFGAAISYQMETGGVLANSNALSVVDVNGDGVLDMITAGSIGNGPPQDVTSIRLGTGDGTFRSVLSFIGNVYSSSAISMSDVNSDGVLDLVTAGTGDNTYGHVSIRLGNGDGSFKAANTYRTENGTPGASLSISVADLNGDEVMDLVTAGTGGGIGFGQATIRLGNGDGSFRSSLSYQTESGLGGYSRAVSLSDLNNDGVLDLVTAGRDSTSTGRATIRLGNGDGTFKAALSYQTETTGSYALSIKDLNGDGIMDMATAGQAGTFGYATVRFGNGDGTFMAAFCYQQETLPGSYSKALSISDINGDGSFDMITAGTNGTIIRLGRGDGSFGAKLSYPAETNYSNAVSLSDINSDGVPDIITAGFDGAGGRATVRLANTRDGVAPILPFSLKSQADALQSLPLFKGTLERLSVQRGEIGAFQSRISSALSTLGSTVLEYRGAQSRVEDIDVANESATLVRQQIVQQAASSVLAQANQAPALALMLLR